MTVWHVLTGEYPPQPGGVSDYTRLVAAGLAGGGDEVHVWAPECRGESPADPGVTTHRLPGVFGRRALSRLDAALARERRPFRLLVQYVPHMYGMRAMNLPFCAWLAWQRYVRPWVMFHEVAYPLSPGQPLRHRILAMANRLMAALLARTADRVFVSIPAWRDLLLRLVPKLPSVTWLPVPSNVPTAGPTSEVHAVRSKVALEDAVVLGHFGTYGGAIADALANLLPRLLQNPSRVALLVGRGGDVFARALLSRRPDLGRQIVATGSLEADQVAAHLSACDLLVQPYPDGVSSRRGSVMAGLALGLPIATTAGELTESVWADERLVALAPAGGWADLAAVTEGLLADREGRLELGVRAARAYSRWFSLEHTLSQLTGKLHGG